MARFLAAPLSPPLTFFFDVALLLLRQQPRRSSFLYAAGHAGTAPMYHPSYNAM
jgi:hypothetical protein